MKVRVYKNIQIASLNIENIPRIGEIIMVTTDINDAFGKTVIITGEVFKVEWILTYNHVEFVNVYLK